MEQGRHTFSDEACCSDFTRCFSSAMSDIFYRLVFYGWLKLSTYSVCTVLCVFPGPVQSGFAEGKTKNACGPL